MPSKTRVKSRIRCLKVANLTNKNNIRILPKNRLKALCKTIPLCWVNLSLLNTLKMVFNRVLKGEHLKFWTFNTGKKRVKRCCFSRSCGSCHKNHTVRSFKFLAKSRYIVLAKPKLFKADKKRVGVEKSKYHRLSTPPLFLSALKSLG